MGGLKHLAYWLLGLILATLLGGAILHGTAVPMEFSPLVGFAVMALLMTAWNSLDRVKS